MNVNEVIANLCSKLANGIVGSKKPVHPNDDVNKSQSSNDVFPSAMHISSFFRLKNRLIPNLKFLLLSLQQKSIEYADIIKVGRTHLMDAVPLSLGQEFSGYAAQINASVQNLQQALPHLQEIALGASAVGTGLNTHPQFATLVAEKISELTGEHFYSAENKFAAISNHDSIVSISGELKRLAVALLKICNDVRWMASGPQAGLMELTVPANEPGSSIMPGKINPSQAEALIMICLQVIGNDTTITFAGSQGNFELNVCKPIIIYNFLQSIQLLAEGIKSFNSKCLIGIEPNRKHMNFLVEKSVMAATALSQAIGYDLAAKVEKLAESENLTIKEALKKFQIDITSEIESKLDIKHMIHN